MKRIAVVGIWYWVFGTGYLVLGIGYWVLGLWTERRKRRPQRGSSLVLSPKSLVPVPRSSVGSDSGYVQRDRRRSTADSTLDTGKEVDGSVLRGNPGLA